MTRLDFPVYTEAIARETRRLHAVLATADPEAAVPGCPAWDATDLLWHLAEVQHFWAWVVAHRPTAPDDDGYPPPQRPEAPGDVLELAQQHLADLLGALASALPEETAWTWSTEQTVGFTFRRQAHEALIHRVDAEQAAGAVTELDPALAADGVEECLAVMYGGCPPWGRFDGDGRHVEIRLTDRTESVWVQLGRFTGTDPDSGETHDEPDLSVVSPTPGPATAVVVGRAADVDLWLWSRTGPEALELVGDPGTLSTFRALLDQPIN